MAIDASIYGQIRAPQQPNLLSQYAQMQQIQGSQAQNRLADLMYGERESEINRSKAIDSAYRNATGPTGVIDRQKLFGEIGQTSGRQLQGIQEGFAKTDKATRDAEKAQIEQQLQRFDVIGRITGGVTDQASYDRSKGEMAQVFGKEAAASMPAVYDPQLISENKARAMDVKTRLEQQWKQMEYSTPNANAMLSAQTSRDNNASSAALTRRGQDMTAGTAAAGRAQSSEQYNSTMGKPFEVTGPNGSPVLVRQDRQGNITAVPGYGPKEGGGKPLTDAQSKAALFGSRMEASNNILGELAAAGTTTSLPGSRAGFGVGAALNTVTSAPQQQLNQAKRDFVNAVLRRESGAVIADSEFANADQQYFPQVGDSKEVQRQKASNRAIAIRGIQAEVPKAQRGIFREIQDGPSGGSSGNIDALLNKYN